MTTHQGRNSCRARGLIVAQWLAYTAFVDIIVQSWKSSESHVNAD